MRNLLLFTTIVISNLSFAGAVTHHEVFVNTQSRTASGTMIAARQSYDPVQSIGCNMYTWNNSQNTIANCYARDSNYNSLGCYTADATKVEHLKSLSAFGYLSFGADSNGYCSFIVTTNQSSNLE